MDPQILSHSQSLSIHTSTMTRSSPRWPNSRVTASSIFKSPPLPLNPMQCVKSQLTWKSLMVVSGHGTFPDLLTKSDSELLKSPSKTITSKLMSISLPARQEQLLSHGPTINSKLGSMDSLFLKTIQSHWNLNQAESPNFMLLQVWLKRQKLWSLTHSRRFQMNLQTTNSRHLIRNLHNQKLKRTNKNWRKSPSWTKISFCWCLRMIGSRPFKEIQQTTCFSFPQSAFLLKEKFQDFLVKKNSIFWVQML